MLQIIQAPSLITFAKNDIVFRLRTMHPVDLQSYRAHGSRASLSTSATFQEGDQITLTFAEPSTISAKAITFTVKNNPAANSTDIQAPADLIDVMNATRAQPFIAPFVRFYVTAANELIAEAIDTTKDWTINFASTTTATVNTYPRTATNAPAGYKVNCDIFFEKSFKQNNFQKVASREITHREDGSDVYINVSEILAAEAFHSLPENPFSQYSKTTPSVSRNLRRYFIIFTEITALGIANTYTEDIKTLIIGGIANPLFLSEDWFSNNFGSKSLFSNRPRVKNTRFDVPEWLSFFNYSLSPRSLTLLIGGYGAEKQTVAIQAPPYECITFAVSPSALGLPEATKYYWVQVLADGVLTSETRHYIVDNTPYKSIRVLAYLNSFGLPETVACVGGVTEKAVIEAENFHSVRGAASAGNILRYDRQAKLYEKEYLYRTGILTTSEKEALTEVALSPVLYDVTTPQYIALSLKEDKTQAELIRDTEETIYSYEWTVMPRIQTGNFSTESQLSGITTIAEPQFLLEKGTGNTIPSAPEVVETGPGTSANPNLPSIFAWEPLTPILDTDLVLFAKTDANGKLIGYKYLKSGDYMRHIRGIDKDSPSHLDGLGFIDKSGDYVLQYLNEEGDTMWVKKENQGWIEDDVSFIGDDTANWVIQ